MIDEQKIIGMLQAKALDCLDAEDNKAMQEFINGGHVFPWDELGHYQNVASHLPLALELELPDTELKDRVALKLIELSEQLRIKKMLEEDKFEVEEDIDVNVDEFTNIPEPEVEPAIEIENEETIIEENLVESLNPEESNIIEEEVSLHNLETVEVSKENLQEDVTTDPLFDAPINETQIDYPKIEEADVDTVLTQNEIHQENISEHLVKEESEITETSVDSQSAEIVQGEESQNSEQKPDLTKKSVAEKVFKALEQDFDSLKSTYEESERKTTRGLLYAYVIIAILLALLIFSFFKLSSDMNSLENEVKELKNKLSSSLYQEQKINSDHYFLS